MGICWPMQSHSYIKIASRKSMGEPSGLGILVARWYAWRRWCWSGWLFSGREKAPLFPHFPHTRYQYLQLLDSRYYCWRCHRALPATHCCLHRPSGIAWGYIWCEVSSADARSFLIVAVQKLSDWVGAWHLLQASGKPLRLPDPGCSHCCCSFYMFILVC